mmetsp:Transcript_30803/g.99301  ORF Transcript_30803/g.99301 Transcript_30803/m.99301 type:complete len:291 (-) Transcript_30803:1375-2247(-)
MPAVWKAATIEERKLRRQEKKLQGEEPQDQKKNRVRWTHPLVLLAAFYSFGLLPLGLLDQGAPHMYANLRLHGGSNHFFFPTGILQRVYAARPTSAFYGGVVRVEKCTSDYFNEIYPSEYTADLTEGTRRILQDAGHTGRMFNPMLTAVTSSVAPWNASEGLPFVKYTMPAHEFRRVLHLARRDLVVAQGAPRTKTPPPPQKKFLIEYTVLDGLLGDETWRATAEGRTIRLTEESKGGKSSCRVLKPRKGPCLPTDLPLLPPLPLWARKILFFEPYPILPDDYRLHCFGP